MLAPLWATLAGVALITGVGRVALSLLPPGAVGSHRPGRIALTWSVSYLLGSVLLAAQATFLFGTPEALHWVLLFVPWLVLLVARLWTLPGALVPRHEPSEPIWNAGQRLLAAAVAVVSAIPVFLVATGRLTPRLPALRDEPESFFFVSGVGRDLLQRLGVEDPARAVGLVLAFGAAAWIACFAHAVAQARRQRTWRLGATLLVSVLTLAGFQRPQFFYGIGVLFLLGAGACFAVPWLRRGDRRSLAIATILLAGAGLESRLFPFALCGLVPLVAATASSSRRSAALWSTGAFLVLTLLPWYQVYGDVPVLDGSAALALGLPILVTLLVVPLLLWKGRADRPRRDVLAVTGAALALLGPALGTGLASDWSRFHPLFLATLIPLVLVLLGIGLLPRAGSRPSP